MTEANLHCLPTSSSYTWCSLH